MKPVRFLRPAELELFDAAQYYELQATGLGYNSSNNALASTPRQLAWKIEIFS